MIGFDNITTEVAGDLINLVNKLKKLPKTQLVKYSVRSKTGTVVYKEFHYTPLDDILEKVKEDNNFALMLPIGIHDDINGVKCILVHKSGHVFMSDTFPFNFTEGMKIQDEGAEITYRKRYAVSAFLGLATEDDTDGNDNDATQAKEIKISPAQLERIKKTYTGDNLKKLLEANKLDKLEDMSLKKASEIIHKLNEKENSKNEKV